MPTPTTHTYYRDNISSELVQAQARVFEHFDIPLTQWLDNDLSHAQWLEKMLTHPQGDGPVVIADIDAFPLSRAAYDQLVTSAGDGTLIGLSQVANHKDPNRIYAGPMFMALPDKLYANLGAPGLERNNTRDVAQALTDLSREQGTPVDLIPPRMAVQPKWALSDQGMFGVGTFYGEMEFFHLFQSRKKSSVNLFCAVAQGTISGRHDFQKYLDLMAPRKKFLGVF